MTKKTLLYDRHTALGAKMVDFAGWLMPLQYEGIIQEHNAVRAGAGIFDVSHMGRIEVTGPDAKDLLNYLSTNKIAHIPNGKAVYTVWCNEKGGAVDDLIIYRRGEEAFFIIVNASNREKDLAHLLAYAKGRQVTVKDAYTEGGILAIQGPKAVDIVNKLFSASLQLKPMTFTEVEKFSIARAGYTGEVGFEIYGTQDQMVPLWDECMKLGVTPIGLGARDTLRLEMGYALYGHELSDTISPIESVASWSVHFDKGDFLGRDALMELKRRFPCALTIKDGGIAREGYLVTKEGEEIGHVTSGTFSPTLKSAIALALVKKPLEVDDSVEVIVRGRALSAKVARLPFIKR